MMTGMHFGMLVAKLRKSESVFCSLHDNNYKAVLCGTTQYSIRPKRGQLSVHNAAYFLHSTMPSVNSRWWATPFPLKFATEWCQRYLPQFSLLFFNISVAKPHEHCGVGLLLVLMRNIDHRTLPKIWVVTFLVRNIQPRWKTLNWF